MSLGDRDREILSAICREYILTGEPVGSRTLVRRQKIAQSAATVRNVMADLEEEGLLQKPHTSAGRVPTDSGLRLFVDRLMKVRALSGKERSEIRQRYQLSNRELQDLLREISRLLSDISKQCSLVVVPRSEASPLKHIEFVQLRDQQMVAVLVMGSGQVTNRLVSVDTRIAPSELGRIHNYLNELCVGSELSEVRRIVNEEVRNQQTEYDQLKAQALLLGSEALGEPDEDELLVEGKTNLLDRLEGNDIEQMKSLLRAVEEKKVILRLLDQTIDAKGVQVFIGAETREAEMRGCSVVASAYGGDRPLGTIGVIGPTNMDYPRVLPVVDYTASILTELLSG